MLRVESYIHKSSKVIVVDVHRRLIVFSGFVKEKTARDFKSSYTIGMWKIKKLK